MFVGLMSRRQRRKSSRPQALTFSSSESESDVDSDVEESSDPEPDALDAMDTYFDNETDDEESNCDPQVFMHCKESFVCIRNCLNT